MSKAEEENAHGETKTGIRYCRRCGGELVTASSPRQCEDEDGGRYTGHSTVYYCPNCKDFPS